MFQSQKEKTMKKGRIRDWTRRPLKFTSYSRGNHGFSLNNLHIYFGPTVPIIFKAYKCSYLWLSRDDRVNHEMFERYWWRTRREKKRIEEREALAMNALAMNTLGWAGQGWEVEIGLTWLVRAKFDFKYIVRR